MDLSLPPNKEKRIIILFILLQVLLIGISFTAGYIVRDRIFYNPAKFPILLQAYNILQNHGFKDLPPTRTIEYAMIKGMVQAYDDPHTFFVEPPQTELQSNQLEGKYGGIGARLEFDKDNNLLLFPFPDSPAIRAGMADGDRLIKIEEMNLDSHAEMDTILAAIRGSIGSKVKVTVLHAPSYTKMDTYTIKREEITIPSTSWNLVPYASAFGIIHVNIIAATTPEEISNAIMDLRVHGASFFILDLRNNAGGLVDAGVNTASLFLESGSIIEEQYRNQPVKSFNIETAGNYSDLPIAVLINQGTASAAEIIAGSLQAHNRATLIGYPSYGKDSIQLIFDLQDGSSLHVTSAHWWVPGIQFPNTGFGLQPDVQLSGSDANDSVFIEAAIEQLQQ